MPYTPEQMFDLVADVARYPEFLPWNAAARVRSDEDMGDHRLLLADLVISFKVFRETFGSEVKLFEAGKRIETRYLEGPFKYMESAWVFHPAEGGCEIEFFVDFEIKNPILGAAIGTMFTEAMKRIMGAFEARAKALYAGQ